MILSFKRLGTALAASALVLAPTMASAANPAASLSLAKARAGTPAKGTSKLAEGSTATFVSIGILAALVVIVLVATGGSDNSDSN